MKSGQKNKNWKPASQKKLSEYVKIPQEIPRKK